MSWPRQRPRRRRSTPAMRRLVAQTSLEPRHLVLPMFVADGIDGPRPIASMPGVVQHTRDSLRAAAADAVAAGVGGLMLFGVPRAEHKDAAGSAGSDPDGILNVALRDLAKDLAAKFRVNLRLRLCASNSNRVSECAGGGRAHVLSVAASETLSADGRKDGAGAGATIGGAGGVLQPVRARPSLLPLLPLPPLPVLRRNCRPRYRTCRDESLRRHPPTPLRSSS